MSKTLNSFAQTTESQKHERGKFYVNRDNLSPILDVVRLQGIYFKSEKHQSPFNVQYNSQYRGFHIVTEGEIYINYPNNNENEIVKLSRGDLILFPHANEHVICDSSDKKSAKSKTPKSKSSHATWLSGTFNFDPILAKHISSILPPFIIVENKDGKLLHMLEWAYSFLTNDINDRISGTQAIISRLLDIVFIECIRDWSLKNNSRIGWIMGALDPRIGKSISAIHDNPQKEWTVSELAKVAGMSRSAYAERFQKLVGYNPAAYVTCWRLDRATYLLRLTDYTIAEISQKSGYLSSAAFSRAFKKQFELTPQQWRMLNSNNNL
ncbi:MAG: AraC family transcriptional regulator [Caulobacterales bacterium]|nr:AraC family transcriptional regulator [Caulobacterales bacterium]MCA0373946.1 AraC family transcriptional regulator [Pseudomonadota bacterium]